MCPRVRKTSLFNLLGGEGLAGFRRELYRCLTGRPDELFELVDAVLCADGPVRVLAGQVIAGWPYSVVAALGPGALELDRAAGRGPDRPG